MDFQQELKSCTTIEQLYTLWHKIYELEHSEETRKSVKDWNTCQFYRFRIEAQIINLEQQGVFLAPVLTIKDDEETNPQTPHP